MAKPRTQIDPLIRQGVVLDATSTKLREEWLRDGAEMLTCVFTEAGYAVPPFRISCSWPGGGSAHKRIGECWPRASSAAKINEMFISPVIDDPVAALDITLHEMCHVVDDCQSGHGKGFKRIATAIGMEGKMRHATAGPALREALVAAVAEMGPYPHAKLTPVKRARKSRQKPFRFSCSECGFGFTVEHKIIDSLDPDAHLACPACQHPLGNED